VAVTDPPPRGTPTGSGKLSQGVAAPLDSAFADAPTYEDHRVDITVVPGIAELVPVARGYFNRFVTPFDNSKVVTVNPIELHQEGRSVFVATNAESSVGLYILPSDPDDERAISLALVPRSIPPRTVRLH
jgi:conjugal transfer pilus assembly protein TraK